MINTKAAVVEWPGASFTVQDVALDAPRSGEVLVRMVAAGLCHTDLGAAAGGIPFPLPGVLGHEGAGVVEEVGPAVTKVKPGDKVVPGVVRTAVDALAIRGTCAVVGVPPRGTEVAFEVQSLLPGKQVTGVTLGDAEPETLIPQLVSLHSDGRLPLEKLITYYRLGELDAAVRDMHQGVAIKPVILFQY